MATFDNILLEGFPGKPDGFILYRHRGKTCLRSKPDKEKIIFTAGMLRQQERLSGAAALYQAVKAAGILPVWQQAAEGTALTGYIDAFMFFPKIESSEGYLRKNTSSTALILINSSLTIQER